MGSFDFFGSEIMWNLWRFSSIYWIYKRCNNERYRSHSVPDSNSKKAMRFRPWDFRFDLKISHHNSWRQQRRVTCPLGTSPGPPGAPWPAGDSTTGWWSPGGGPQSYIPSAWDPRRQKWCKTIRKNPGWNIRKLDCIHLSYPDPKKNLSMWNPIIERKTMHAKPCWNRVDAILHHMKTSPKPH